MDRLLDADPNCFLYRHNVCQQCDPIVNLVPLISRPKSSRFMTTSVFIALSPHMYYLPTNRTPVIKVQ